MTMDKFTEISAEAILVEENTLLLNHFDLFGANRLGDIAKSIGLIRALPIAVEVRIGDWIVFHTNLPGSNIENDLWISRKARVVKLKHHSTLYERISAEERSIDWFLENNVNETEYAIHGGGLPLVTKNDGFVGTLLISGLPQVEDHLLGVEVLTEFLARKGKLL